MITAALVMGVAMLFGQTWTVALAIGLILALSPPPSFCNT